jgi:hypothetical protein
MGAFLGALTPIGLRLGIQPIVLLGLLLTFLQYSQKAFIRLSSVNVLRSLIGQRSSFFRLEVPSRFLYTDSMKNKNNKNNRTAAELLDLIVKVRREVYKDGEYAYAYASGVIVSLMDWELKGYDSYTGFQEHVNNSYEIYSKELAKHQVAA